jgi:hypothetical protein
VLRRHASCLAARDPVLVCAEQLVYTGLQVVCMSPAGPACLSCMHLSCMPVLQAAIRYLRMQSSSACTAALCGPGCVLQSSAGACKAAGLHRAEVYPGCILHDCPAGCNRYLRMHSSLSCSPVWGRMCPAIQCWCSKSSWFAQCCSVHPPTEPHIFCTPVLQAVPHTCACRAARRAPQPCVGLHVSCNTVLVHAEQLPSTNPPHHHHAPAVSKNHPLAGLAAVLSAPACACCSCRFFRALAL